MRSDAEVTAAAERTADITLRLVAALRERDRARAIAVALEQESARIAECWSATIGERDDATLEVRRLRTRLNNVERDLRQHREMRATGDDALTCSDCGRRVFVARVWDDRVECPNCATDDVVRVPLIGRAT